MLRHGFMFAALTLSLGATAAQAQYTGPSKLPVLKSVAEVVKGGKDDQPVIVQGVLKQKIDDDTYLFNDGTGDIRVDIDSEKFPKTEVGATTKVEIRGEVSKDALQKAEIDADVVTVLP